MSTQRHNSDKTQHNGNKVVVRYDPCTTFFLLKCLPGGQRANSLKHFWVRKHVVRLHTIEQLDTIDLFSIKSQARTQNSKNAHSNSQNSSLTSRTAVMHNCISPELICIQEPGSYKIARAAHVAVPSRIAHHHVAVSNFQFLFGRSCYVKPGPINYKPGPITNY